MRSYLNNDFDNSKLADLLDELPLWSSPFGLKLLDHIDYKSDISALDIGFGTGFPLTEIAMRLGKSSTVYGIDPWKEAIAKTKEKLSYYQIENVQLIEGIAESIPLKNETIDLITSNNGINNVNNIDKAFSECSRVMKSKAQFVQTMNTAGSMFEFYDTLKKVLHTLNMDTIAKKVDEHIDQKRPSVDYIKSLLVKHGFDIKEVEQDQFNYTFSDGTAMLNHYFIRVAFMDSWIQLLPTDKVDTIFEITESELNKHAKRYGYLKLSIPYVLINAVKK